MNYVYYVVIRTNSASTDLIVNAPLDNIKHYGSAGVVDIKQVSNSSFWEFGSSVFVELGVGRIVLTEESDVEVINVTKKDENTYNNPIIADGGVKEENMPEIISRDQVNVTDERGKTELVQIQKIDTSGNVVASGSEQVYAYSNGAVGTTEKVASGENKQNEDIDTPLGLIVLDSGSHAGEKAYGEQAKETKKNEVIEEAKEVELEAKQAVCEHDYVNDVCIKCGFVNPDAVVALPESLTIGDGEELPFEYQMGMTYDTNYFTVSGTKIYANGATDSANLPIITLNGKKCNVTITEFHAGTGAENDPYIIYNKKQLHNIGEFFDSYNYYEVDPSIKKIDCSLWSMIDFNGSIEGNNVTLDNLTDPLFDSYGVKDKVYVSNLKIKANIVKSSYAAALFYYCPEGELIVDNVDISGYIEGTYSSCWCAFGNAISDSSYNPIRYGYYTFKNCEGTATLVGTSNTSGFIGHLYCKYSDGLASNATEKSLITIQDSKFIGKTYTPNGQDTTAKYIAWNGRIACKFIYSANYDVTGLYGTLGTPNFDDGTYVCGNSIGWDFYLNPGKTYTLVTESGTTPAKGQIFEYDNSTLGADHASICFIIAPNDKVTESGSFGFAYLEEDMKLVGNTFKSSLVKNYDVLINPDGVTAEEGKIYKIIENTINVVYPSYGHTHSGAYVQIKLYDSNDELLKIVSYHVADSNALAVWYGPGYTKSAAIGNDYVLDLGYDLTNAEIVAQYYGGNGNPVIESQYIHTEGTVLTIDAEALRSFTGGEYCIYIYDNAE